MVQLKFRYWIEALFKYSPYMHDFKNRYNLSFIYTINFGIKRLSIARLASKIYLLSWHQSNKKIYAWLITLSAPKNKLERTLIPLNLSIMSSQPSGKIIVVSVSLEMNSFHISNRVEISKTNALFNISVLKYDSVVMTEEDSPDGLIIFVQRKEATKRWLAIAGDTKQCTFSLSSRLFRCICANIWESKEIHYFLI